MTDDSILSRRWRCRECNAITMQRDQLSAPSPFEEGGTIWGCPACLCACGFDLLCDVAGCDLVGGCGWPSPAGYRWTCHTHAFDGGL